LAGACLPGFWLGPLLILLFSLRLAWLPVSGRGGLSHLVLPATTLGLGMSAILVRLVRTSMIAALGEDFVRSARAKGAPEWRVVAVHALRNALLPVTTVAGLQAGALLAGPIITETIFAWPGPGRLLGQDSLGRDVLARVMRGARISFAVGATVVALSLLLGVTVGAAAGYLGGWFDEAVARVIDVLLAFPGLLLAIALAAVLGPSLGNVVLALSLLGWTGYARLARAEVAALRQREFVEAARALAAAAGRYELNVPARRPAPSRGALGRPNRSMVAGLVLAIPEPRAQRLILAKIGSLPVPLAAQVALGIGRHHDRDPPREDGRAGRLGAAHERALRRLATARHLRPGVALRARARRCD